MSMPADSPSPSANRSSASTAWVAGAVLVAVGVVILLGNLGLIQPGFNWWALFILIPALAAFANSWKAARRAGSFNRSARGSAMGGLFILAVALIFLLDLDWGKVWPVFIILAGIGALLTAWGR